MRKLLIAAVLFLSAVFIITRFAEAQAIIDTLKQGEWPFLVLALLAEILWILSVAAGYRAVYQAIGQDESIRNLLPVAAASIFLNIVAPSVGMSGMAAFVTQARRQKYSSAKAAVAGALFVEFDYAGFLTVLAVGFLVLIRRNDLNLGELVAALFLFIVAVGIGILIYLGMYSEKLLGKVLAFGVRLVNQVAKPFIHREYLHESRAYTFAAEAASGLKTLQQHPQKMLPPYLIAIAKHSVSILILYLTFLAFRIPATSGTLIAGFSVAYLFLIVSPTPQGVGFVEGILTLLLSSMYVPLSAAAVITLAYRGYTFWVPLLIGGMAFRWLVKKRQIAGTPPESVEG